MMGQIRFVPIYREIAVREVRRPSIIAHKVIAWSRNNQGFIQELKHNVYVNLWLIEFELEWIKSV